MQVAAEVLLQAQNRGLDVEVKRNGSRGAFWLEPLVEIESGEDRIAFGPVCPDDVAGLFEAGLPDSAEHPLFLGKVTDIEWLTRQDRLTFGRAGVIDPLSLDDYKHQGGYEGLNKALAMSPEEIVEAVTDSGLRGRGGAAFPTGIKWRTVLDTPADQKYVTANADEGDSGTFADRLLMEADPFQLIEGMTICAMAVGATRAISICVPNTPKRCRVLSQAIATAEDANLLGRISAAARDFHLHIRVGAGAYICGEETSMLESLEGKRGLVRFKPPLPAIEGLFGKPTVVNNVLTLAAVSTVLAKGAAHYRDYGSGRSRGTLSVQLAGNIRRGGLVEVPLVQVCVNWLKVSVVALPAADRCGRSRWVVHWVPIYRSRSGIHRWITKHLPTLGRCWVTVGSWSLMTVSICWSRPVSPWSFVPWNPVVNARPAVSVRFGVWSLLIK